MRFPEEVMRVVREANVNHPTSIENATSEALNGVIGLESYKSLVATLVEHAVHDLICDDRHSINTSIKRQSGAYAQVIPKTTVGTSDAVMRAEFSVYSYRIAGTALGEILGKDCSDIAGFERNKKNGHAFNERLMTRLAELVPKNKKVKDAVSERKLKQLFCYAHAKPSRRKAMVKKEEVPV